MQVKENMRMVFAFAFVVIALILTLVLTNHAASVRAAGQTIQCFDSTSQLATTSPGYNRGCAAVATTSPIYLGIGTQAATTTLLSSYVGNATSVDVNMDAVGSSTAAVVLWNVWFSNDNSNWYQQSASSIASGVNTLTALSNNWATGATTTPGKMLNMRISTIGANYIQIRASGSAASSSVYAQLIVDNAIPN